MNIHKKIEHFITKHTLIERDQKIIIGLSGGPDSVFLLYALVSLQKKYNLTLIAAHLNHEWRLESNHEEQSCRELAEQLDIPFVSAKLSELSSDICYNGSKEEYARNMRRYFFEKVLQEHSAHRIALGHHAQDQQETFFIRLIRGTSLAGLTAINPQHDYYIRPLLETNKHDILNWLNEHNIAYALDASNDSQQYLRNRIRSAVLPALRECDSRFEVNFLTTLDRLKTTELFLERLTTEAFAKISSIENKVRIINIPLMLDTDKALHQRIIIHWLITENVPFPPTQAFLDEIIRFLESPQGGVHAIHAQWSIVKKQQKAFILLITPTK
jgi:tRNA(Ile)-lysidine synthase